MIAVAPDGHSVAPRATLLLPVAYLLHFAEEWFGGFSAWTLTVVGEEVAPARFLLINGIAFPLFIAGTLAAYRNPRMAWFSASLAALLGLNGALHILATLGFGRYAPGAVTGLLLYLPLSAIVLRWSAARLSGFVFAGSIVFGILIHGLVSYLAFL
jgi:hypothetical protein